MSAEFQYDVFLSHSSKDKTVVRPLAERLRADGLKVWFDEWVLKPGDPIQKKIDDGLEHSRVLVLCMSAQAFGSDWAQLEVGTFRFRDPLNKERRFIPVRLDDAPIKGSLAQFLYINWCSKEGREEEYTRLKEACCAGKNEHTGAGPNAISSEGWNRSEEVRIVTLSSLVRAIGDQCRYEILVQAKNVSDRAFGKSGISVSIPTINTRNLYWDTWFNTDAKAPWAHPIYGPEDRIHQLQQHEQRPPEMKRSSAQYALIETIENYWEPETKIQLRLEFQAPVSQIIFGARTWADRHRTDWTTDMVRDPASGSGEQCDQQNFETYWRQVGLRNKVFKE
jgi:hypothetical protein